MEHDADLSELDLKKTNDTVCLNFRLLYEYCSAPRVSEFIKDNFQFAPLAFYVDTICCFETL